MTTVTRETTESKIVVRISPAPIAADYRKKINPPIPFLSHMIEQIVWRCGFNIVMDIGLD